MVSSALVVVVVLMLSHHVVAANSTHSSQVVAEADALRNSGWWKWEEGATSSNHCNWLGITCNEARHVIGIRLGGYVGGQFSKLNLSSFPSLYFLILSGTGINGTISDQIGTLTKLTQLDLSRNELSGSIPHQIGGLTKFTYLDLSINQLTGGIPHQIGSLTKLTYLDISNNQLTSSIPHQIGTLRELRQLDLSLNHLTDSIPSSIGFLTKLTSLNLRRNRINGSIPPEIGYIKDLIYLKLDSNSISGGIPSQLKNLKRLERLDLYNNNLSGKVPPFITHNCKYSIDLSSNDHLKAYTPSLCNGGHKIALKVSLYFTLVFVTFIILGFVFGRWWKKRKVQPESTATKKKGDLFSIWGFDGKLAFEDIVSATKNFDIRYCIGVGGCGNVYRARLPCGNVVAVKKLHGSEIEEPTHLRSFENEVRMLEQIRHRDIVKLYGYCLHNRCMFLISMYMERGSLFCMLSNEDEVVGLDWSKRVNIVKNIAHALSYLHHDCTPPIIHRDISSNNILLNSELDGFVSDFGIARLLNPDSSNRTHVAGTYGYIAPGK